LPSTMRTVNLAVSVPVCLSGTSGSTCVALTVVNTSNSNRRLGLHRRLFERLAVIAVMKIEWVGEFAALNQAGE
jgi:hypothetical protein